MEERESGCGYAALRITRLEKPWIVPIPGTTKLHRLEENIGAADVEMNAQDLNEIGAAASQLSVKGERLPEPVLRMTGL